MSTPDTSGSSSVGKLDRELAQDIDQLAGGDFESVDNVLEGATEEGPLPVNIVDANAGDDGSTDAVMSEQEQGDGTGREAMKDAAADETTRAPAADDDVSGAVRPVVKPMDDAPEDGAFAEKAGEESLADDRTVMKDDAPAEVEEEAGDKADTKEEAPSEPSASPDTVSAAPVAPDAADTVAELDSPAPVPAPAPSESPEQLVKDISALGAAKSETSTRFADVWSTITARIWPSIAAALALSAIPLRYVPESMRPLVDWVAISLVFWVPIVWVLAFLLTA